MTDTFADSTLSAEAQGSNEAIALDQARRVLEKLRSAVRAQVLGRDDVIDLALIALVADGHVLLEDFPGSGKTTLLNALQDEDKEFGLETMCVGGGQGMAMVVQRLS